MYIKGGSITLKDRPMILAVRKFWQSGLFQYLLLGWERIVCWYPKGKGVGILKVESH